MLEIKDYHSINMIFAIVTDIVDRTAGLTQHSQLTTVHTVYSEIINELLFNGNRIMPIELSLHDVASRITEF